MSHTSLVLGASEEFVDLVRMARARGIRVVVCDGRENSPAKAEADVVANIPVTDIERVAELCRKEHVDAIVTGFSDLLLECATLIADRAGIPFYLKPSQLPYYRDKGAMKAMFHELCVPTAKHVVLADVQDCKALEELRFPVVAKPVNMYGSRGVTVIHTIDELKAVFSDVCASSLDKRVLVEEYNEGYEFNLMSWVHDGEVHILGIADREKTPLGPNDIPYSCRNVYPSRLQNHVEREARSILQRIVAYTGQTEGELSMQFFWNPGGRVEVCEVAARFLGYEHELITLAGGLSLEELMLDATYDKPALETLLMGDSSHLPSCAAVLYFQGRPGTVSSLVQFREMERLPGVQRLWLYYDEGDRVAPFVKPYFARCVISAPTRAEVDALTQGAYEHAHVLALDGNELLHQNQQTHYRI